MENVIQVEDRYYILASKAEDQRTHVLKQGDSFAIFNRMGDIETMGMKDQGFYHGGTRFLSRLRLRLDDQRPLRLSSTVKEDNVLLAVDLMNPDLTKNGEVAVPRGLVHIFRGSFLWEGACYQRIRFFNYGKEPTTLSIHIDVDADFADLFEVRGMERAQRGNQAEPTYGDHDITLNYDGLDEVHRSTKITFKPDPDRLEDKSVTYDLRLEPGTSKTINVKCGTAIGERHARLFPYDSAHDMAFSALQELREASCTIYTSNEQFNEWVNRSLDDVLMMTTQTEHGLYPYAGVPWYNTTFGRDGLITALQTLWINPSIARGVLSFLAAHQSSEYNDKQDAEPGKIVHEMREGEMAELGEIPFKKYYGTIDATPLFIVLAGSYIDQSGDHDFLDSIWPHVERALHWIDNDGDPDGDGFVEYQRRAEDGLDNQGWKDSFDAIFMEDGTLVKGHVALCEVQGYVYQAKRNAARMADLLGKDDLTQTLRAEARDLKQRFHEKYWSEELNSYVLALNDNKEQCHVPSSNAGHALFSGIADAAYAKPLADTLFHSNSFCGWGIRTLPQGEARYNPMSYHNGSIWPHDNALIAKGLARYGMKDKALKLLTSFFDASLFVDANRLPELFCGFRRRTGKGPTEYPVACLPQAWASGAIFMMLQACLGLSIDGDERHICFKHPRLPASLDEVRLNNITVGDERISLHLIRHEHDVGINIIDRSGPVRVSIEK